MDERLLCHLDTNESRCSDASETELFAETVSPRHEGSDMAKFRFAEQLRDEIQNSKFKDKWPVLASKARVDRPNLIAFMRRRREGMSLETFERICRVLGFELHKPAQHSNK